MKLWLLAGPFALRAREVSAHGSVYFYVTDGVTFQRWFEPPEGQRGLIQRRWHYLPLEDPLSPNLTCNHNGEAVPGSYHAPAKAGGTVDNDCARNDLKLGYYCNPEDKHREYPEDHSYDFPSGNYLVRHEIMMTELWPPQFYPTCAALAVEGEGTARLGEAYLVKFPGAYSWDGISSPPLALCSRWSCSPTDMKLATDPGLSDKVAGRVYYPERRGIFNNAVPGPKVRSG
ncbi:hypothetical protein DL768_000297 [Monosporascus sp. mg162]|nr:hypothetical protein DL768_000297 [Monosporascus sp. mg162]